MFFSLPLSRQEQGRLLVQGHFSRCLASSGLCSRVQMYDRIDGGVDRSADSEMFDFVRCSLFSRIFLVDTCRSRNDGP